MHKQSKIIALGIFASFALAGGAASANPDATRQAARQKELIEHRNQLIKLKADLERLPNSADRTRLSKNLDRLTRENEALLEDADARDIDGFKNKTAQRYVNEIDARITHCGTDHLLKKDGKTLYGSGSFRIHIDRDGRLLSKSIVQQSELTAVDEHMLKLIEASAPFGKVPVSIHDNVYRRFSLYREFKFIHDEKDEQRVGPKPRQACRF